MGKFSSGTKKLAALPLSKRVVSIYWRVILRNSFDTASEAYTIVTHIIIAFI
jgi:hypothetical protein